MTVRRATAGDAASIARVHADGWRTSYTGMIPESAFAGRGYEDRLRQWTGLLSRASDGAPVFVAEADEGVVGFVSGGATRSPELPFDGELYAIYVLPHQHGAGIGAALFRALAGALAQNGQRSLVLWVVEANPSRAFYERMGGVVVARRDESLGEGNVGEVAYGFRDLGAAR